MMAKVANVHSIDPEFECVLMEKCIESVGEGTTDVLIASIERLRAIYEYVLTEY